MLFTPFRKLPKKEKISLCAKSHLLLDLGNGLAGVETLGAGPRAVENGVAAVQAHGVLELALARRRALVSGVDQPPVRLQQDGGAEVLFGIPPVRGARRRAAGAQDALVQAVQLLPVRLALAVLLALFLSVSKSLSILQFLEILCSVCVCVCFRGGGGWRTSSAGVSRCR